MILASQLTRNRRQLPTIHGRLAKPMHLFHADAFTPRAVVPSNTLRALSFALSCSKTSAAALVSNNLRTLRFALLLLQKRQHFCFLPPAHSLRKTTGGGVPLDLQYRTRSSSPQTRPQRQLSLTSFFATHPRNASVTPIIATHPKTQDLKSRICHTYEKGGGCPPGVLPLTSRLTLIRVLSSLDATQLERG